MGVKCFYLEPTSLMRQSLRRFVYENGPITNHYHDAVTFFRDVERVPESDGRAQIDELRATMAVPDWPIACACGYAFQEKDEWQSFNQRLYRRADTGELVTLRDAPPGAMWDATWYHNSDIQGLGGPNTDGRFLVVKCPNGREWCIDSRCSNCGSPDDNVHRCWVRHGEPPNITVDKNGVTCSAGAGSIQAGDYHGFLRGGEFT